MTKIASLGCNAAGRHEPVRDLPDEPEIPLDAGVVEKEGVYYLADRVGRPRKAAPGLLGRL
jgi:hypothetical protein